VSGLSTVANPYNCMDGDQSTAATLYATANVAAQQQLTGIFSGLFPTNSYAHILVENPAAILSLSLLNGPVTIQLLNDGNLVQSTATSAANLLALQLLSGSTNKGWINVQSTGAFNQVKVISNSNVVGLLQTFNVYEISRDYSALALPVQYANELSGIYNNGNIDLTWTTSNEINNRQFDIMKSQDAVSWNALNSIPSFYANGNGNGHTYSYTDTQPFSGTNYYKLIQYDLDGKSSTGKIISLNVENNNKNIKIYPNPTIDKVNIDNIPIGTTYRVIDLSGKIISSGITNSIPANISVTNANSGILFINLIDNMFNKIGTFKIIKSK
jgi:cellobiose phosphorylase